jgi:S-adenosyl methyltransferase
VRAVIDFDRPVGALLVAVLNFVGDADNPAAIIGQLRRSVPPGSLLALSHGAREEDPHTAGSIERIYQRASGQAVLRTRSEVLRLLEGCEQLPRGRQHSPIKWAQCLRQRTARRRQLINPSAGHGPR